MPQQRVRRILSFLADLEKAQACTSRQEAFELVHSTWLSVNQASAKPDKDIEAFRLMRLRAQDGWKDLDADPCYLLSIEHSGLCIYLHNDGAFVIQDLGCSSQTILISKLGAKRPLKKPAQGAAPVKEPV